VSERRERERDGEGREEREKGAGRKSWRREKGCELTKRTIAVRGSKNEKDSDAATKGRSEEKETAFVAVVRAR
jgi:hypothetical protein